MEYASDRNANHRPSQRSVEPVTWTSFEEYLGFCSFRSFRGLRCRLHRRCLFGLLSFAARFALFSLGCFQRLAFAVDDRTLGKRARVTHVNLNDGTVEGLEVLDAPAFSVQYHPESSPGPHDARALFGRFVTMMEQRR